MWKFCSRLFLTAAALAAMVTVLPIASSHAESACDRPDVAEVLPPLPAGCHRERISVAGELSYNVIRSAKYLGQKAWQRLVLSKYGERFQRWELAACPKIECVPGALAGSSRCTFAGFPCSPDVDLRVLADLTAQDRGGDRDFSRPRPDRDYGDLGGGRRRYEELDRGGILEMQDLLARYGFSVSRDGEFGPQTSTALIQWQRRAGIDPDGLANFGNLEQLRRAGR